MKRVLVPLAALAVILGAALPALSADPAPATPAPAPTPPPLIDMKGVNADKFARDLGECRALAETAVPAPPPPPATKLGKLKSGATGVAKAGAKAVSKNGLNVIQGSKTFVNEVSGGPATERKKVIVANCLKGRGYAVLE